MQSSFENLIVWKKGILLVKSVYKITGLFPASERYGLTDQLRRSSASILANIAEGSARITNADKSHKYTIARGECTEVEALILLSMELGLLKKSEHESLIAMIQEVGRMLSGLIRSFHQKTVSVS